MKGLVLRTYIKTAQRLVFSLALMACCLCELNERIVEQVEVCVGILLDKLTARIMNRGAN